MDKYTLLILLNLPFVIFGYTKALVMYRTGDLQRLGFFVRLLFWTIILLGLVFAESIYNFLFTNSLTDTTPLSLADVVLVTGIIFTLSLCLRLYSRIDALEKRVSELHEKLSVLHSQKK